MFSEHIKNKNLWRGDISKWKTLIVQRPEIKFLHSAMTVPVGNKEPPSPDTEKKVIEMQYLASQVALEAKNPTANTGDIVMQVWSLGWEDPLEEGMATHSSFLAWRIRLDGGPWGATVHGVAQSWTWLKELSTWATEEAIRTVALPYKSIKLDGDVNFRWHS